MSQVPYRVRSQLHIFFFFYIFLNINQLNAPNFIISLFQSSTCFEMFRAHVLIVRRAKIVLYSLWYHHTYRWPSGAQSVHGTATYRCDDTRDCIIQFLPVHGTATYRCDDTRDCIIQFFALLTMSTCARNM